MDERVANVVFEFGNCEVKFVEVFEGFSCEIVKEVFGEGAYDGFLIVSDNVVEELVDKLDFEIGEVEASIVI
jgi:hypothetical protein